jgi:hypothetical protein
LIYNQDLTTWGKRMFAYREAAMASMRHIRAPIRSPAISRAFTTSLRQPSTFNAQPSPPRLPKEEQEQFEKLLRDSQAAGAFGTPRTASENASSTTDAGKTAAESSNAELAADELRAKIAARGNGEELHPNVRRGSPPEFEGDVNPATGEVGGPKNEPLRWGKDGDWSYNGRVTDF